MIALGLVPVIFVPVCHGTRAALIWSAKEPVRGKVASAFPVLLLRAGPEIVPYGSPTDGARLSVEASRQSAVRAQVKALRSTGMADSDRHIEADVDFHDARGGLQRIHVNVHREMAMGTARSESWYDTDGRSIVPRYEREYFPSFLILGAALLAVPLSFVIAVTVTVLLSRRQGLPILTLHWSLVARLVILAMLYAAIVLPLRGLSVPVVLGFSVVVAAAVAIWRIHWTRRRTAVTLLGLLAVGVAAAVSGFAAEALTVIVCVVATVALVGVAAAIERSFSAALNAARSLQEQERLVP